MTRSQFIEKATLLYHTVHDPIQAIADLVESNFSKAFQPEPLLPHPKVVIEFPEEPGFNARTLFDDGRWIMRARDGVWHNEDPDPIQRKLAELLLDDHPATALTFERGKWRRVEGIDDLTDTELAGERGYEGDV